MIPRPVATQGGVPRAVVVSLLGLLGFLVLTAIVLLHPEPLPLDRALHEASLEHREPIATVAEVVTALGTGPVVLAILLVVGVLWARARSRWWLVLVGPALLSAGAAVRYAAMLLIDRPRPPVEDWIVLASGRSFPSGHTTTAALAYGLAVVVLAAALRPGLPRAVAMTVLLIVAGLVGASRVVLGVHWTTDVFGGWCLGLSLVAASALVISRLDRPDAAPAAPAPSAMRV